MVNGKELSQVGYNYLGRSYDEMDCQKFIEHCLEDCGNSTDLTGSNAWYRKVIKEGWVGTPEECVRQYGQVPPGAFLFILEPVSSTTPAKYRDDGIGDATHIGLVTGIRKGAIHSSHSKGGVVESAFAGKTVPNGGWNRVGLWTKAVDYFGVDPQPGPTPTPTPTPDPKPVHETAVVSVPDHTNVITRKGPGKSYAMSKAGRIPDGDFVEIIERNESGDWCKVLWIDPRGASWVCWVKAEFLKVEGTPEPPPDPEPVPQTTYVVTVFGLNEQQAAALVQLYPNQSKWEKSIG